MLDIKQINVGDIVKMKKPIPVGQQSGRLPEPEWILVSNVVAVAVLPCFPV